MEETSIDELENVVTKVSYYSVLVKAVPKSADASDQFQSLDQVQISIFVALNQSILEYIFSPI